MIPAYIQLPTPILGCTHARPYARTQFPSDPVEHEGQTVLGPLGGRVVISYEIGHMIDGAFRKESGVLDREIVLEGDQIALLRAYTHLQGAPVGSFRDSDVLAFALGQLTTEQIEAAEAQVAEWRVTYNVPAEEEG